MKRNAQQFYQQDEMYPSKMSRVEGMRSGYGMSHLFEQVHDAWGDLLRMARPNHLPLHAILDHNHDA